MLLIFLFLSQPRSTQLVPIIGLIYAGHIIVRVVVLVTVVFVRWRAVRFLYFLRGEWYPDSFPLVNSEFAKENRVF